MSIVAEVDVIEVEPEATRLWWVFLVSGIAWVVIAFAVLSFDPTTPAMIGYLTGFVLIAAGVNEFVTIGFVDSWKWVYGVLGALFVITGVMALTEPFQTFGILALLIGWYLLFRGIVGIILSIWERDVLPLWGLSLVCSIFELALGVWALGYPGRSAWLLVLWIGTIALVRGVTEIVLAFKLRGDRAVAA